MSARGATGSTWPAETGRGCGGHAARAGTNTSGAGAAAEGWGARRTPLRREPPEPTRESADRRPRRGAEALSMTS